MQMENRLQLNSNVKTFLLAACLIWFRIDLTRAMCGRNEIMATHEDQFGSFKYKSEGMETTERCSWSIKYAGNENVLLVFKITNLAFRKTANSSITLPDGTTLSSQNSANSYLNKCFKFAKRTSGNDKCWSGAGNKYCGSRITELDTWPPVLRSEADHSYQKRSGYYAYPLDFTFQYRFIQCSNYTGRSAVPLPLDFRTKETTLRPHAKCSGSEGYFVSTVILSCLVAILLLITSFVLFLLLKRSRKENNNNVSRKNSPVALKEIEELSESVEKPYKPKVEEQPLSPGNNYSRITEENFKSDDNPNNIYSNIGNSEIVDNELYETYRDV